MNGEMVRQSPAQHQRLEQIAVNIVVHQKIDKTVMSSLLYCRPKNAIYLRENISFQGHHAAAKTEQKHYS